MIKALDLASVLTAVFVLLAGSPLEGEAPKTYVSAKFHYSLEVPKKWNISTGDVPVLFNYRPSEGGPQGLFPDGGAEIYLIPLAVVQMVVHAKTIDEWISDNNKRGHSDVSIKRIPNAGNDENAPRDVVEVVADFERAPEDGELQHETNYYFTLRGAPFRLMLLCWKHDPRAASYAPVAASVLRSIRARTP